MQVFISYDPARKGTVEWVTELSRRLATVDVGAVCVNLSLRFNKEEIVEKLPQATVGCERVIIVLSKSYLASEWMQRELLAFYMLADRYKQRDWLVPIAIDECQRTPYFPALPMRVDTALDTDFDRVIEEVFRPPRVFFVMKFGDPDVDAMYQIACSEFGDAGFDCFRVDAGRDAGSIPEQIESELYRSAVVFVDLTDNRPNCYYEAGFADGLHKDMVLTVKQGTTVHFDLSHRRHIQWRVDGLDTFRVEINGYVKVMAEKFKRALDRGRRGPVANTR